MGNVQVSVVVTFIARLIYFEEAQLKANGKYHYLGDAGDLLGDGATTVVMVTTSLVMVATDKHQQNGNPKV